MTFDDFKTWAMWASAVVGIGFILYLVIRTDRKVAEFRIVDLILEGDPPKASVSKLILLVFASLSVWVVVLSVLDNKIDTGVRDLLLGVLGIFVIGRTATQAVNTISARRYDYRHDEVDLEVDRPIPRPKRDSVIR